MSARYSYEFQGHGLKDEQMSAREKELRLRRRSTFTGECKADLFVPINKVKVEAGNLIILRARGESAIKLTR